MTDVIEENAEGSNFEGASRKRRRSFSISDLALLGRVTNRYVAKLVDFLIALLFFAYDPLVGSTAAIVYMLFCDGFKWGGANASGMSIGKKLSGVKTVSTTTGAPAGYAESAIRNAPFAIMLLAYLLIGWIPYVGKFVVVVAAIAYIVYEVMQMNVDGLRLGDRLARTRVVDADFAADEVTVEE